MKKLPYTIIIVGLIDILFFFPAIWYIIAVAVWDSGMFCAYPGMIELEFKNTPKNAVYIDLLTEENDGYVRLSKDGSEIIPIKNGSVEPAGMNLTSLKEEYGALKAAYVDENGSVLGVTEAAEWGYNGGSSYALRADGDSLLITFPGRAPAEERAALIILFSVEGAAFAALSVFVVMAAVSAVKRKRERSSL